MADSIEGSAGKTTGEVGGVRPEAKTASNQGGNVVTELVDAAQAGADRLQSQGDVIPRYLEQTGSRIENFSRSMRNRSWRELVADTEEFARHRPTMFLLSAIGIGFAIG